MPDRLAQVKTWLDTKAAKPLVIFGHWSVQQINLAKYTYNLL